MEMMTTEQAQAAMKQLMENPELAKQLLGSTEAPKPNGSASQEEKPKKEYIPLTSYFEPDEVYELQVVGFEEKTYPDYNTKQPVDNAIIKFDIIGTKDPNHDNRPVQVKLFIPHDKERLATPFINKEGKEVSGETRAYIFLKALGLNPPMTMNSREVPWAKLLGMYARAEVGTNQAKTFTRVSASAFKTVKAEAHVAYNQEKASELGF